MQHPKLVNVTLFHPLTGGPIVPLGYRKNGRPIWPILGGAPDDDDKGKGDDGKESEDGKSDDDATKAEDGKSTDEGKKADDDKGAGGKDALKADLARERDKRQQLEKDLTEMKDGFAKALGLKPEETSDTEKLEKGFKDLQERLDKADRQTTLLTVATEFEIGKDDLHMLTATDEAGLRKQAEWIKSKTDESAKNSGRRPKPDVSQGGSGSSGGGGSKSVTQVMEERRAAREAKQK
ncbi:MAG: hypothetical protein JWO46_1814 [Nocardioidaceae bacterium]|nr:hypothetical protein [Nocardioidaceae bacterium]